MSDFDKQNLFLYESVHSYPVKRRRPRNCAGTLMTNVYKFHLSTPRENILRVITLDLKIQNESI